ncbi:hypothetical protein [Pantoea sp. Cy-639]|uniref:hypothetical protein n=1 Tax=Pantoea sp. Cy-639 TaxID=2608360 RepID=UPI001422E7B8|nr:hypothetical protein [Pantoea sp. Cy-639]
MGRFTEMFKYGYNKSVIEKAMLKHGDNIRIQKTYNNASTYWSVDDEGITAAQDSERKYPRRFVFDKTALGRAHTELLLAIDGIATERITVHSCNPKAYERYETVYNDLVDEFIEAGAIEKSITDIPALSNSHIPVLIELKEPAELHQDTNSHIPALIELKEPAEFYQDTGTHDYTRPDHPLPAELGNYSIVGYMRDISPSLAYVQHLSVSTDEAFREIKNEFAKKHRLLNYFKAPDDVTAITVKDIRTIYSLENIELFKPAIEARKAEARARDTLAAARDQPDSAPTDVTAFVPTPFNDALPCMVGFAEERIGIPRCEWTSPCYLLADRDLALNEVIRVWAVGKDDGRILKMVALTATAANRTKDKWPAALVTAIRDDDTLVDDSKLLHGGVIKGTTFEVGTASYSTADCIAASSREDYNRLWVFSTHARLFTNAPFAANQVMAHNLASVDFQAAHRMCVQVRDRISQGLLESIVVTFEAGTTSTARARALCEAVMHNSQILRAGVLEDNGISITLNDQGNSLWMPQLSDLSVTVDPAPWVVHDNFAASRALAADEELRIHIHDDVTGMQLTGSPFIFTAGAEELDQCKWPVALAERLQASLLGDYLALELGKDNGASSGQWKCAGVPLRILMSAPLEESNDRVPMLSQDSQPDQPITINERLLQLASSKKEFDADALKAGYYTKPEVFTDWGITAARDRHWEVITIEVTLQDNRTGYICYRSQLKFKVGYTNTFQAFTQALINGMRNSGLPDVTLGDHPSPSNDAESPEKTITLWLPKKLGMTGTLCLQPPTKLTKSTGNFFLNFTHTITPTTTYSESPFDYENYRDIHYSDYRLEGMNIKSQDLLALTKDNMRYPNLVSGGTAILSNRLLQLNLEREAISAGVRFTTIEALAGRDTLFLSSASHSSPLASVGVIGAYFTTESPWHRPFKRDLKTPPDHIASFSPDNTLCADRCMTLGAHVYDTGGARDNGVDENTGLFHAHYPLATLRGLEGKGPELDLTLHYSAVRANEGALGDGWAFRFSYFDNRRRVLTLSSGHTLTLTKAQMKSLSADKTKFLDQDGYRITAVEGDEHAWTALTVQMPAGSDARQEVLQVPATHDGKEASEAFKTSYKKKLQTIIANLTQWIDKEKITNDQIANLKKQRETWKAELAEIDRKGLVLVTSSIRSPQGGELKLAWQGIEGHIRLDSITDASTVLLRANHGSIALQGSSQSTFTVWPDTPEGYEVTLDIRNCLLESIKRHRIGQKKIPERYVRFDYDQDPALDRVLTSIAEEDGSLEVVRYQSRGELAPRVVTHTLVPGAEQQCISHHYEWEGKYVIEQLNKRQLVSVGKDAGPFVLTTWTFNDGVRVVDSIMEEQPGSRRRTTRFTYPATASANDYKYLILSRPIRTEVTSESLTSN